MAVFQFTQHWQKIPQQLITLLSIIAFPIICLLVIARLIESPKSVLATIIIPLLILILVAIEQAALAEPEPLRIPNGSPQVDLSAAGPPVAQVPADSPMVAKELITCSQP